MWCVQEGPLNLTKRTTPSATPTTFTTPTTPSFVNRSEASHPPTTNVKAMGTSYDKEAITRLLKDYIVQLFQVNTVYDGHLEVDGIICITGQHDGQELVVKVHEKLQQERGIEADAGVTNGCSRNSFKGLDENDNRSVSVPEDSRVSGRLEECMDLSWAPERGGDSNYSKSGHESNRLHSSPVATEEHNGPQDLPLQQTPTPPSSQGSPVTDKRAFMSRPSYFTPPLYLQKRALLRAERWTPGTPLPTIPECKPCGYTFESFEILCEHNEAVHSVFTCEYCYKTFTSRSNLERHARLHTGHRPYVCAICGKAFSRKDHLTNHSSRHAFKCSTCQRRFMNKQALMTHYSYEHSTALTNVCEYCNKGFSSVPTYEEHIRTHPQYHVAQKPGRTPLATPPGGKYQCSSGSCKFTCLDRITLFKHKLIHTGSQRCYTCLSCAKVYSNPLAYSYHLHTHSAESNVFECCFCRQIFPHLDALKKHELIHLTEHVDPGAYYPCGQCNKVFQSPGNLKEHMEIHESMSRNGGGGSYCCSLCGASHGSYPELSKHMEDVHRISHNTQAAMDVETHEEERFDKEKACMDPLDSDVEVVEPESPDELVDVDRDAEPGGSSYCDEYVITENPTPVIEVKAEDSMQIKMDPVRSLLYKTTSARKQGRPQKVLQDNPEWPPSEPSMGLPPASYCKQEKVDTVEVNQDGAKDTAPAPPHYETATTHYGIENFNFANYPDTKASVDKGPEVSRSQATTPNKLNIDIPAGPFSCSICGKLFDRFSELESHCFSDHTRSPCMFCSKTFAQKANRDRHVCLHTGDKPYACPDCDEKFSRGDKLKLHRVRVHNTAFPQHIGRPPMRDWTGSPFSNRDQASQSPVLSLLDKEAMDNVNDDASSSSDRDAEVASQVSRWVAESVGGGTGGSGLLRNSRDWTMTGHWSVEGSPASLRKDQEGTMDKPNGESQVVDQE